MGKNIYGIEIIITLLSLRDKRAAMKRRKGIKVHYYSLSRETESAVEVKKNYLNGKMNKEEYEKWCDRWIRNHDITDEEWTYLYGSQYLKWVRDICTK